MLANRIFDGITMGKCNFEELAPGNLKTICQWLQIISIILQGLKEDRYYSKREIYYAHGYLFENQEQVNQIVKRLAYLLQVPRRELHVVSASKGLICGAIKLHNVSTTLDLMLLTKQGKGLNISEFMDEWSTEVYGDRILVVEKETVYFHLLSEGYEALLSQTVLITGKGYPCHATRAFLKYISLQNPLIPIYYLGDMDPYGLDILCQYAYGNPMSYYEFSSVPWIRWLNMHFTTPKQHQCLTIKDSGLLNGIKSRKEVDKQWIDLMIKLDSYLIYILNSEMMDFIDQDDFYGIPKSLYFKTDEQKNDLKKADQDYITKTGTDFVLLPNSPEFLTHNEPFEPMYIPKQTILEESLRREIEKICFADTLYNRVVFDCVDQSPFTKDIEPSVHGLEILPYYIPQSKEDVSLVFESRFESGNLRRAIQICEYEYNIILKPDYYTTMNTQWFYFSIANTRKDVEYRFNIINMMKPDSLYNSGMKPLVYSEKASKIKKIGWFRDGHDICYYQNNMKRKNGGFYYTLTFALKFHHDFDCIYIAHCYPYTYTQLCKYLKVLEADPAKKNRVRRKQLCQTIAGNMCDFLIIGDFNNGKEKKGIIITSRVHPGETMASYVMEYIIDFLTGNTQEARILRENFIFKIIPMLNIDGVVNGNYRCNLAGVDLNRQWIDPSKKLHPTIYHAKQMVKKMKEERELVLFCDIHGHSRKKNIFMYGCTGKDPNKKELVFPMLNRNNCSVFSFKDCCFLIQKDREGSARIALWKDVSLVNCYTLEISFCGADFGKYEYFHFNLDIYKEIAQAFCLSIIDCYEPEQIKVRQIQEEIEQNTLKNQQKEDKNNQSQDEGSDYSNDDPKEQTQQQVAQAPIDTQLSQVKKVKKIPMLPPKKKK